MISRNNYEIYFVDYFDGRLDENAKGELFSFLEVNSDLKEEFEQFEKITAKADSEITFRNKEGLKKGTPTLLNYKTWMIAEMENDLNKEQVDSLNEFTGKHADVESERQTFGLAKLIPEEIVFPGKKQLKKGPVIIPIRRNIISISAAAAVAIFILGYLFFSRTNKDEMIITDAKRETKVKEQPVIAEDAPVKDSVIIDNPMNIVGPSKPDVKNNKRHVEPSTPLAPAKQELYANENTINPDTLKNPDMIPEIEDEPVAFIRNESQSDLEQTSNSTTMSDIFDEDELKELKNNSIPNNGEDNSLSAIASKELKSFSEKTGISLSKNKNKSSVTYAFSVKQLFSVSHSRARQ